MLLVLKSSRQDFVYARTVIVIIIIVIITIIIITIIIIGIMVITCVRAFCSMAIAKIFASFFALTSSWFFSLRIIIITRPWPAFGRQGLVESSGGYTSHE